MAYCSLLLPGCRCHCAATLAVTTTVPHLGCLQVLASLAEEPQEFASGLEVLDSIVKIYTVFARLVSSTYGGGDTQ